VECNQDRRRILLRGKLEFWLEVGDPWGSPRVREVPKDVPTRPTLDLGKFRHGQAPSYRINNRCDGHVPPF
jgi:hypothetical protein